jgi:hypothetical protein
MSERLFDALFGAADEYHRAFTSADLTAAPTRHLVVLTCMDARLDLFRLLGLEVGCVREDVLRIRACPFLPHDLVVGGAINEVGTGQLVPVDM